MSLSKGWRRIGASITRTVSIVEYEPLKVTVWDERIVCDEPQVVRLARDEMFESLSCELRQKTEAEVSKQFGPDAKWSLGEWVDE